MAQVAKPLTILVVALWANIAWAGPLDEMALDRWAKLKEAERYQLNVAEKYWREKKYKVAGDEYEKFLKLYENSEGAPFAQLKWAHCQVEQRKLNAAIKDGYQTLLDYFPDSPEAPLAAMLIGRTQRAAGDIKLAKKAYSKAITTYPKHLAAVLSRADLADIAEQEKDTPTRMALLQELTFNVERKGPTIEPCTHAARDLTQLAFTTGNFEEGMKALETTTKKEDSLPAALMHEQIGRLPIIISQLTGSMDEATRKLGTKLADAAAGWLKTQAVEGLADEKRRAKAIDTWYKVAEVRRAARQPEEQKKVYEEMSAALPGDDTLLGALAQWHKENKQADAARAIYGKFKDVAEGQHQIAHSYSEEKLYDKSGDLYRKLALSDTKNAPRWSGASAQAYRLGGKPDEAIKIYQELLQTDTARAGEYHFQIAETLYYANRWKEAITAYRGTDRFPHNYQHMAMANRQLKQFDEAIALYRQIMAASEPTASWALYQIGVTQEQAGKTEDAIKSFKQVCDRFPKSQEGSQAHAHLNQKYKITVTLGGAKD